MLPACGQKLHALDIARVVLLPSSSGLSGCLVVAASQSISKWNTPCTDSSTRWQGTLHQARAAASGPLHSESCKAATWSNSRTWVKHCALAKAAGHRPNSREQSCRLCDWLIRIMQGGCWLPATHRGIHADTDLKSYLPPREWFLMTHSCSRSPQPSGLWSARGQQEGRGHILRNHSAAG